jgi:peptidoglycan-associated lipoprotein
MKKQILLFLLLIFASACHQAARPKAASSVEIEKLHGRVQFDTARSSLESPWRTYVVERAQLLKAHPDVSLILEGHADQRGSAESNIALGDRRARRVKWEMVQQGIDPNRIVVVSYGKSRPLQKGRSLNSYRNNRRVEIVVK